jgi:hypothetical protein
VYSTERERAEISEWSNNNTITNINIVQTSIDTGPFWYTKYRHIYILTGYKNDVVVKYYICNDGNPMIYYQDFGNGNYQQIQ